MADCCRQIWTPPWEFSHEPQLAFSSGNVTTQSVAKVIKSQLQTEDNQVRLVLSVWEEFLRRCSIYLGVLCVILGLKNKLLGISFSLQLIKVALSDYSLNVLTAHIPLFEEEVMISRRLGPQNCLICMSSDTDVMLLSTRRR